MSYSIEIVGRDKEKLKAAIRKRQATSENPHSGVPPHIVEALCTEVDRARVYEFTDTTYGLKVKAEGSFHEQGRRDYVEVGSIQVAL